MGPFDIIVIVLLSVAVLAVIGSVIYKKMSGKGGGCDCGCEGCPHSCACKGKKPGGRKNK